METDLFDIIADVLQGDALALHLFITSLDYVLRTSIDLIKENGFLLKKKKARTRRYPPDDIALLINTPIQAESLLYNQEQAGGGIGLNVNANKTEYMCFKSGGAISTLSYEPLKLID